MYVNEGLLGFGLLADETYMRRKDELSCRMLLPLIQASDFVGLRRPCSSYGH